MREIDPTFFRLEGGLESRFLRGAAVVLLLALALRFYLGRYEMVYNEHGSFLVGIDYVDQNVGLPLQWLLIVACLAAAVLVWMGRWMLAATMALALVVALRRARAVVSALYVRPNEISLERPYIQTHIHATRSAYGLEQHVRKSSSRRSRTPPSTSAQHQALLDNVRLWDWRPSTTPSPNAGAAALLRVPRQRRGPLHHRRPVPPGAARAARAGHQPASRRAHQLDQPGISSTPTATAWCWRKSAR